MTKRITIVSPFFNEEECAELFFCALDNTLRQDALSRYDFSLVFVNDGSTDRTALVLKSLPSSRWDLKVVSLARNFGHQLALSAGMDYAGDCDAVVLMDSDLQHPPDLLPQLINLWEQGFSVVQTVRKHTKHSSFLKEFTSDLFYKVFNALSDTRITPGAADFCLLDKTVLAALRTMRERHRFLRGLVAWSGFRRAYLEYIAPERKAGTSKYTPSKMIRLALDAVFSFSAKPAKMATWVGLALVVFGWLYLLYALVGTIARLPFVHGWASLLCTSLILNGMTLCILGIHGQYLARIFEEIKGRPLYTVEDVTSKPCSQAP